MAEVVTCTPIAKPCSPTLAVSRSTLPVAGIAVVRLLNACCRANAHERGPIEGIVCGKGELLFRGKRSCVVNVAYIEVWDNPEQALLLFRLDLLSGDHLSGADCHLAV